MTKAKARIRRDPEAELDALFTEARQAVASGNSHRVSVLHLKLYRKMSEMGAHIPLAPGAEEQFFDPEDAIRLRGFGVTLTKDV